MKKWTNLPNKIANKQEMEVKDFATLLNKQFKSQSPLPCQKESMFQPNCLQNPWLKISKNLQRVVQVEMNQSWVSLALSSQYHKSLL